MHVVCFGPGPKFKGGIAQYNTALARSLKDEGAQVTIVSWTQQYPAIIPRQFVDRASRSGFLADHPKLPADLKQKVLQSADELERTVRIRRADSTSGPP